MFFYLSTMKYLIALVLIVLLANCGGSTGSEKQEESENKEEKELRKYSVEQTTYDLYDSIVYFKRDMSPVNAMLYGERGDIGKCING